MKIREEQFRVSKKREITRQLLVYLTVFCLLFGLGNLFVKALAVLPTTEEGENALSTGTATNAETTTLRVNKLILEEYQVSNYPKPNPNGRVVDWSGGTVQSGVPFQLYNLSLSQDPEVQSHLDLVGADASANMTWLTTTGLAQIKAALTPVTVYTNGQGMAEFPNLTQGVYLVDEGSIGSVQSSIAVPFVVNLPMAYTYQYQTGVNESRNGSPVFDQSGNPYYLEVVNVYPKNLTETVTLQKSVANLNRHFCSREVGVEFPYFLQTSVPKNIDKYNKFELNDVLDSRLTLTPGSVQLVTGAQADENNQPQGGVVLSGTVVTELPADLYTGWVAANVTGTGAFWTAATDYYVVEPVGNRGGTLTVALTQAGLKKLAANAGGVGDAKAAGFFVTFKAIINETAQSYYGAGEPLVPHIMNKFRLTFSNKYDVNGNPYALEPGGTPEERLESNEVLVFDGGIHLVKINEWMPPPQPASATPFPLRRLGGPGTNGTYKLLAGAEFKVYNLEGLTRPFPTVVDESRALKWTSKLIEINQATGANAARFGGTVAVGSDIVLKTGTDGRCSIQGLRANQHSAPNERITYTRADANSPWVLTQHTPVEVDSFEGFYGFKEITAPAGYVASPNLISMRITEASFYLYPVSSGSPNPFPFSMLVVNNFPRPFIPQTGGIGAAIFVVVGALVMLGGLYGYKKRQKKS